MNTNRLRLRWMILAMAVLLALTACKLAGPGGITIQVGATNTPVPSNTPAPLPTATAPAPSPTPVAATATQPPALPITGATAEPTAQNSNPGAPTQAAPTQAAPTQAAPTQAAPTQALENKPGIARVEITNGLGNPITIVMNGPEQRSFTVRGSSSMVVEFQAGTYSYTITSRGYLPIQGEHTFIVGDNTWDIGK